MTQTTARNLPALDVDGERRLGAWRISVADGGVVGVERGVFLVMMGFEEEWSFGFEEERERMMERVGVGVEKEDGE